MPYADPSQRAARRPSRSKHTHLDDGDPYRMYCGVLRKHRGAPRSSTQNPADMTCPRCQQRWGWSCVKVREQPTGRTREKWPPTSDKIGCPYCYSGFNEHNTHPINLCCRSCGRKVFP